jgi:hypothetical protein
LNEEEAETLKNLANEIKPDIPRSPGNAFLYCKDIVDVKPKLNPKKYSPFNTVDK